MSKNEMKSWVQSVGNVREGWLRELVESYELDWRAAIKKNQRGISLASSSIKDRVEELPDDQRQLAQSTIKSIDQYYRRTLDHQSKAEQATKVRRGGDVDDASHDIDEPTLAPDRPYDSKRSLGSDYETLLPGPEVESAEVETLDGVPSQESGFEPTLDGVSVGAVTSPRASAPADQPTAAVEDGANFSVGAKQVGAGARIVRGKHARKFEAAAPGTLIGDYRIEKVLGQGGMGVVYLATQQKLDRLVALKMILGSGEIRESLLERFDAEAKAIAKFQHENIVRIFETSEHAGMPFFSLEFIEGATLSDLLQDGPMAPIDAAGILAQVARGLQYAHDQNIIHRDIKPANVLLTNEGVPKVSDFGLAREIERDQSLSMDGAVVGTPGYMAPEQARGARDVGAAADIWGMGAMLYAMLTGRAPFVGSNPGESLMMLLRDEPVPPSRLRMKVPQDIETICLKCLEKDIEKRYETAEALAEDLERYTRGEPISARPISKTERVVRWCKRNPKIALPTGIAASLALALAVGGPLAAGTIYQQKEVVQETNQQLEATNTKLAQSEQEERAARELAQQNEVKAKQAEVVAVEAKELAQRNAESAQVGYKSAVDALKSLVFGVLRKLEDRPGMQDVREELLVTAREGLQRLDSTASDPTQNNILAAGTLRRLGDVNFETGRMPAAKECYGRCLEIVTALDAKGELPGRFHNLSTARDLHAQALKNLGELTDAQSEFKEALELRRQWLATEPNNEGVRQNVAATLGRLAFVEMDLGNLDEAESLFDESAEIRQAAFKDDRYSLGPKMEWLGAKWSLEKLRMRRGDLSKAATNLMPIAEGLETLAEANPFMLAVSWNAGLAHMDLARWSLYQGKTDVAAEAAEIAFSRLRQIRQSEKKNLRLDANFGQSLNLLISCRRYRDPLADEKELVNESIQVHEKLLTSSPSSLPLKMQLVLALATGGELEVAVAKLDELPALKQDTPSGWWECLASINNRLAQRLMDDEGKSDHYLDSAMKSLRRGIQSKQLNRSMVQMHPEWKILREQSEWSRLAENPQKESKNPAENWTAVPMPE